LSAGYWLSCGTPQNPVMMISEYLYTGIYTLWGLPVERLSLKVSTPDFVDHLAISR
jgi:hypothetical protein